MAVCLVYFKRKTLLPASLTVLRMPSNTQKKEAASKLPASTSDSATTSSAGSTSLLALSFAQRILTAMEYALLPIFLSSQSAANRSTAS